MNDIVKESLKSIETHLNNERQAFYGIFKGQIPGGFCRVLTRDRSYFIQFIVDEHIERVYVDLYPQITVEKPFRQMVHAYVNEKTSTYKSGRIDIDNDNGELKIRVETSIADHSVSVGDVKDMEHLAVNISDGLERRLDKMSHGVYFREDDPDLMSESEKKLASLKKKLSKSSDDDDSDDSDPLTELFKAMSSLGNFDNEDDSNSNGEDDDSDFSDIIESFDYEEKIETSNSGVDLYLLSYGENKLYVIKCVREITGISLADAKHMVEMAPIAILKNVSREEAERAKYSLEAEGATVEIR